MMDNSNSVPKNAVSGPQTQYIQISVPLEIPIDQQQNTVQPIRRIFISYCWRNSKQAEQLQQTPLCYGNTDPRTITKEIEQVFNEKCWLDVDITNGARASFSSKQVAISQAEVVVACISDQYVRSDTCEDELNYARKHLKKPVIPIIVGEGMAWQNSWAGSMLVDEIYIDFRESTNFNLNMDQLIGKLKKFYLHKITLKSILGMIFTARIYKKIKISKALKT